MNITPIFYLTLLMCLNVLFYIAIIVVVNILLIKVGRLKKEVARWGEIEKLITIELKELIKTIKN